MIGVHNIIAALVEEEARLRFGPDIGHHLLGQNQYYSNHVEDAKMSYLAGGSLEASSACRTRRVSYHVVDSLVVSQYNSWDADGLTVVLEEVTGIDYLARAIRSDGCFRLGSRLR